jgi:hypothetical protein
MTGQGASQEKRGRDRETASTWSKAGRGCGHGKTDRWSRRGGTAATIRQARSHQARRRRHRTASRSSRHAGTAATTRQVSGHHPPGLRPRDGRPLVHDGRTTAMLWQPRSQFRAVPRPPHGNPVVTTCRDSPAIWQVSGREMPGPRSRRGMRRVATRQDRAHDKARRNSLHGNAVVTTRRAGGRASSAAGHTSGVMGGSSARCASRGGVDVANWRLHAGDDRPASGRTLAASRPRAVAGTAKSCGALGHPLAGHETYDAVAQP